MRHHANVGFVAGNIALRKEHAQLLTRHVINVAKKVILVVCFSRRPSACQIDEIE